VIGSKNLDPSRSGAVAQLGERLLCKQEVIGSIPFGSTSFLVLAPGSDLSRKKKIASEKKASSLWLVRLAV
jgi:hypothetical protein